mmetsp:Transcript_48002/g.104482  ORF Transcript_48002/g.104482 Transcript_48002/m.104482 type:complete len:222 (+) Transcript_48002:834-1499(+)
MRLRSRPTPSRVPRPMGSGEAASALQPAPAPVVVRRRARPRSRVELHVQVPGRLHRVPVQLAAVKVQAHPCHRACKQPEGRDRAPLPLPIRGVRGQAMPQVREGLSRLDPLREPRSPLAPALAPGPAKQAACRDLELDRRAWRRHGLQEERHLGPEEAVGSLIAHPVRQPRGLHELVGGRNSAIAGTGRLHGRSSRSRERARRLPRLLRSPRVPMLRKSPS